MWCFTCVYYVISVLYMTTLCLITKKIWTITPKQNADSEVKKLLLNLYYGF